MSVCQEYGVYFPIYIFGIAFRKYLMFCTVSVHYFSFYVCVFNFSLWGKLRLKVIRSIFKGAKLKQIFYDIYIVLPKVYLHHQCFYCANFSLFSYFFFQYQYRKWIVNHSINKVIALLLNCSCNSQGDATADVDQVCNTIYLRTGYRSGLHLIQTLDRNYNVHVYSSSKRNDWCIVSISKLPLPSNILTVLFSLSQPLLSTNFPQVLLSYHVFIMLTLSTFTMK